MAKRLRKNKLNLYQVIFSFCKVCFSKTDYVGCRGLPIRLVLYRKIFFYQGRSAIHFLRGRLYWDMKLLSDTDERRSYPPLVYTLQKRNDHQHSMKQTQTDRLLMVDFAN